MKNKMRGWLVGGLITAAVFGVMFGFNSMGNAAEKTEMGATAPNMMMQNGQMSPEMMNSPEMQKQCGEMMTSPEMQKTMKEMMQQPKMQNIMKQMMASDPAFKQMMSDLVNNADNENTVSGEQASPTEQAPAPIDHNAHHAVQ